MKVNPSAGFERYKSYMQGVKNSDSPQLKTGGDGKLPGAVNANTDKVMISEDATARAESSRLAKNLAGEVDGSASPERLAQLRATVEDGSYSVSTGRLVQAILGYGV